RPATADRRCLETGRASADLYSSETTGSASSGTPDALQKHPRLITASEVTTTSQTTCKRLVPLATVRSPPPREDLRLHPPDGTETHKGTALPSGTQDNAQRRGEQSDPEALHPRALQNASAATKTTPKT